MKYLAVLFLIFIRHAASAQQWQQMTDFPGAARDDGTTFTIGNKVYCGLGMNAWFGCNADFYAFDLDLESWSPVAGFPEGQERQYAGGFAYAGNGYVFGGIDGQGNYRNDLRKYNPVTDSWTILNAMPADGRSGMHCFVIADTAYTIGGKSASEDALDEVWAYDLLNGTWSQKSDLPSGGIWRGVSFAWDGKGFVGLGKDNAGNFSGQFHSYDPASDAWQTVSGFEMEATAYTASVQIGQLAFLYGGMNASGAYLNNVTRIDLETFGAQTLAFLPAVPRRGGMAFAGDDEFYITTGVSASARLTETWKAGYVLATDELRADEYEVHVFPNPSSGTLHIISDHAPGKVTLSDPSGKKVLEKTCSSTESVLETNFPAGVYLLSFSKGKPVKIVIQ